MVLETDGFVDTLLFSWAGMTFNGDRRPKGCALKVTSRSITPHEEANTVPVFTTPIPGIASRMSMLVRILLVFVSFVAFYVTL